MKTLIVNAERSYKIIIGENLLCDCAKYLGELGNFEKIAIVTDDTVDALYAKTVVDALSKAGFDTCKFVFPHGESSKSHAVLSSLYDFLASEQITRTDLIVALGGGVVGDLTGYAAATYLRGVRYVQMPTTLLSAVDSSVGGKTAVNISAGKNLVGAFWQPSLVLCDTDTLSTLPPEIVSDGLAEVVKYGCIVDSDLFTLLQTHELSDILQEVIYRCVDAKRKVVESDERDTGIRQILNFGHTIGHAIEKHSCLRISHGHAVAMGMVMVTKAAEIAQLTAPGTADQIKKLLQRFSLESVYPVPIHELIPYMATDKKRAGKTIQFILLKQIGESYLHPVKLDELESFLSHISKS